ncbi:pyocin activator PrtN family protein [Sulfurimonas sp. ST-27]|uniref:pyocin activator PrtN family protein n=1 Tax=Sulfurimonas sp. ST-27 TaxID=3400152 RepID=UPI003AB3EA3C
MTNTEQYMNLLYKKYNKMQLTRKEVAEVLEISLTSLDTLITNNTLPIRYRRIGNSQKARYIFPILEVANFLAFEDAA